MIKKHSSDISAIEVDIVSDFVCPWCWLGYKYFLQAQAQSSQSLKQAINVTWRPYMLDPNIPEDGVDYKSYMAKKFGSTPDNRFKLMRDHLQDAGPEVDIHYDFAAITRRPNSLNAHRLMRWAQGQNLEQACAQSLFTSFMEQGGDIGDAAKLADIGQDIGLDRTIITDLLASDKDKAEIENEVQYFRDLGVSGVPTFIYNGQFTVQGAQDAALHLQIITKLQQGSI